MESSNSRGSRDSNRSHDSRSSSNGTVTPRSKRPQIERDYNPPKSLRKKPNDVLGIDWNRIVPREKIDIYKSRVPRSKFREGTIFFPESGQLKTKKKLMQYIQFDDNINDSDIFLLYDGSAIFSNGTYFWDFEYDSFSVSYKNLQNDKIYLLYPHEIEGIVRPKDGEDYKRLQLLISQYNFSKPQTTGGQKKNMTTKKRGPVKTKK